MALVERNQMVKTFVTHVPMFLVNGSRSRVMFSSRDRPVAIALGAHEVRIDTMEPDQAVQLIQL